MRLESHIGKDLDVSWRDCGYFTEVPWKMRYACFHSREFMWCEDCPRVEGVCEPGTPGGPNLSNNS